MFGFKKSTELSTLKSVKVRGYEIKRAPIAKFLEATRLLQTAPLEMLQSLFATTDLQAVLGKLSGIGQEELTALLVKAVAVVPQLVIELFCEIAELDKEALLNDTALGLDGIVELMNKWVEINGLVNFTRGLGRLIDSAKAAVPSPKRNTGYSVYSPPA